MSATRFLDLLRVLGAHQVDFIIVGGAAGVLLGAPFTTQDIDIVYERSEANIVRLLGALAEVDAIFAHDLARRRLAPSASHLRTPGPKLLETRFGRLDILGQIRDDLSWPELVSDAVEMDVGDGLRVRVVSLPRLIEIKQWLVSQNLRERGGRDQFQLIHLQALAKRLKSQGE